MERKNSFVFLGSPAGVVAPQLLGCVLERTIGNKKICVKIVETEAYDEHDVASHSYNGKTKRNEVMFGPAGYLYVYFTYGMHYCCNVVCGLVGQGSAVLIRAVEPLPDNTSSTHHKQTNGPAKLCKFLEIDRSMNGHNLHQKPLRLIITPPLAKQHIVQTKRIGLSKGKDVPWRFYIKDSPYVSRPSLP
jgi:DNA-3-methyladenine glycosylase